MKRLVFFLGCLASLPFVISATSGACSDHGGVNCSIGPNWDGGVICNDGWRDSSIKYIDMQECKPTSCSTSSWNKLLEKYDIPALRAKVQSEMNNIENIRNEINQLKINQQKELDIASNRSASATSITEEKKAISSKYNSQIAKKTAELNYSSHMVLTYQKNLSITISSAELECKAIGLDEYYNKQKEDIIRQLEAKFNNAEINCPINSTNQNNKCICNEEYLAIEGRCLSYNEICQDKYGSNSYGDKDYCYCSSGYEMNSDKSKCVPSISCPINSQKINNECICNEGYVMNENRCITHTENCINNFGLNIHGQKGNNGNSSCFCDVGYKWSSSQNTCIKQQDKIINNKENQTVNDIEIKKEEPTSNVANDVDTNINQSFYEFKLVGNENIRECGGFDCKILKFGSINATANILEKNDEWFKVKVHENGKTMEGWINSSLVPDNIKSIQNKKDDLKNNTSDANQVDSTNNVKNSENKKINFFKNIFNFFKR